MNHRHSINPLIFCEKAAAWMEPDTTESLPPCWKYVRSVWGPSLAEWDEKRTSENSERGAVISPTILNVTRNSFRILGALLLILAAAAELPADSGVDVQMSASRFQILDGSKGEAVLDTETQLIWERSPNPAETVWANASLRCALSSTGGRLGWRLPSFFELMTLVEPSPLATANKPSLPAGHPFRGVRASLYWTTNSQDNEPTSAYVIDFLRGDLTSQRKNQAHACWCVRGGLSNPPTMSFSRHLHESI